MKKSSKLMRASGVLLVLTLITSCFVGGTFAKYTTKDDATDEARVAKWGVTVEATEGKTFSNAYGKNVADRDWIAQVDINDDDDLEVVSVWDGKTIDDHSAENLIAPGTQGSFGGIAVSGQPEVAVEVKTTAVVELGDNADWTVNDQVYCPLIFKVGEKVIDGLYYSGNGTSGCNGGIDSLEAEIKRQIDTLYTQTGDNSIAPGTELNIDVAYEWAWLFDEDDKKNWSDNTTLIVRNAEAITQDDKLDTLLGNKFSTSDAPEISIEVTTTVTQVD